MRCGIKLQSCNRYILWCNDNWFETVDTPFYAFSCLQDAWNAIKQMVNHYIYHVTLIVETGESLDFDFGQPTYPPEHMPQTIVEPVTADDSELEEGDFSLF